MTTHVWVAISHEPDDFTLTVHTTPVGAMQALVDAISQSEWDQFASAVKDASGDVLDRTGPVTEVLAAWYGELDNTDPDQFQYGHGSDTYGEIVHRQVLGDPR